jgi:hypothetical protein
VSTLGARRAGSEPLSIVRLYLLVLGAGLLLEGAALLVLDNLKIDAGIATNDWRHNVLHIVWGIALLVVSAVSRGATAIRAAWAALIFGTFYIALGVLGLTVERPFGLQLGPGENAFHFTVGPLALLLGTWALRSNNGVATSTPVVLPARTAVPARRRRPPPVRKRVSRRGTVRRR